LGVDSSVKLLYLGILYCFIGAGKFFPVFSIASSMKKMLPNKIVSLYSIFFSKIVYQYRFNRYISEYRCPPMPKRGGGGGAKKRRTAAIKREFLSI
jgi:hypothetical protein